MKTKKEQQATYDLQRRIENVAESTLLSERKLSDVEWWLAFVDDSTDGKLSPQNEALLIQAEVEMGIRPESDLPPLTTPTIAGL